MEKEIDIKIFIQDDGKFRITGTAGHTDASGLWHGAGASDDDWDKLVMGNTKFVRELKKLMSV